MKRLPLLSFCALVVATVSAFFITQHLKVTTPLIQGFPAPVPSVIDPLQARACGTPPVNATPPVNHGVMRISFWLQHRSDHVDVWMVNSAGGIVATLASNRYMRRGVRKPDGLFFWNGREDDGSVAPDGVYYIKVALTQQGRTVDIANTSGQLETVTVDTRAPRPRVLSVTPHIISPTEPTQAAIRYTGTEGRGASVLVYRTDLPGGPRLVKTFGTPGKGTADWDGRILGRPAPAGIYLVGLRVTDAACNVGHYPARLPVRPGVTPNAGVSIRYLAAEPPLDPVVPGTRATVLVDSRMHPYHWSLERPGARRALASGASSSHSLDVPLPAGHPGLYELALRYDGHTTAVPLVAHAARPARLLVVLPALTWQGLNPGDEDGDGVPDTLSAGAAIDLVRPFATGLPAGLGDLEGILSHLETSHRSYDLTTDLGLIDGVGPSLSGHQAVLLAGTELWVGSTLAQELRSYVQDGGHVLSLGVGSLLRQVRVSGGRALSPSRPAASDLFGARPGALTTGNSQLIGEIEDGLGIFHGTAGLFGGYRSYETIQPPAAATSVSEAGTTTQSPSIVGYRLARGEVVYIALPGFGSRLAHDPSSEELFDRVLGVLLP